MKNTIFIIGLLLLLSSCEERTEKMENSRGIPGPEKVDAITRNIDEQEGILQEQGYQTRRRQTGDSAYLMQQYYVALFKAADNEGSDTTGMADLQREQEIYVDRLTEDGRATLAGNLGDESEVTQMIIFNTPAQSEADSLTKKAPMVEAGFLNAEVHPMWLNVQN